MQAPHVQRKRETHPMNGRQLEQFCDALCAAFNEQDFEQLLRFRLERRLPEIAGPGNLRDVVFHVVTTAEREGWLQQLLRNALEANPGNQRLREFDFQNPEFGCTDGTSSAPPSVPLPNRKWMSLNVLKDARARRASCSLAIALSVMMMSSLMTVSFVGRPPQGPPFVEGKIERHGTRTVTKQVPATETIIVPIGLRAAAIASVIGQLAVPQNGGCLVASVMLIQMKMDISIVSR